MLRKLLFLVLAFCSGCGLVAQPQPQPVPFETAPATVRVPKKGVTVPMENFGGRPVVEVKINGKGPFAFILDTAADVTVIFEKPAHPVEQ